MEALTRAEEAARAEQVRLDAARKDVTGEIASLKRELADATRNTQAFEREADRLGEAVASANDRIAEIDTEIAANRERATELLAALQRVSLQPSMATIADPDDAVGTAQAAQLIDGLTEGLRREADRLVQLASAQRDALATAQRRRDELTATQAELRRQRERITALVAEKEAVRARIIAKSRDTDAEIARLADEARTLRELLDRLAEPAPELGPSLKPARPAVAEPVVRPDGTARFADAKGALLRPVAGTLSRTFGRGDRGQSYSATTEAQVIAPYAGRVEFAGPFKGYGRVVILNMDDDYFLLLTGLEQIFVDARESVLRGEPIGVMPAGGSDLYLELRHKGRTIDPAPWFG